MKKNAISSFAAVLLTAATLSAQQPVTYTQYGQQPSMLNPAASLARPEGEVSFVGRRQWVGMEGSPTVFWGGGHMGFGRIGATGGINVRHESLAVEDLTEASVYFAKGLRISESEYVGLSLNAGVAYLNGRFSQLDPGDPAFREDIMETDVLVGFGLVVYRPGRYYAGLSLPRLMLGNLGVGSESRYNFRNQYHLSAGALFALGRDFHVRPSLLVTYAENLRPQAEVQALFFVKEALGVGLNVRSYGDLAGMLQVNFSRMGLGYSYQFNPGNEPMNRRIENTTHEIGISYRFGKNNVGLL